ncbi:Yae1 domain-containing protein 1 [Phytophthora citrophthora]|uniref:Yae1 domain-containing protein 1 n=1 Tax=Phytophthora citrophthora TaxID=4793 RepID=A0AAD9LKB8_9STRA|nr:Yae1 domain-containing protein 1 [Phytophthora citrophthora]
MTSIPPPALDASDSDDGFQDFLSEEEEEQTLLDQESVALERRMKTMGIRDGLELGKEDTLQQGFDEGFTVGAAWSFRFGKLRGALGTAVACGLLDAEMMTQAKACMAQLRTLEMDTSVLSDDKKAISSEEDTVARQAHDILKSIGLLLQ